ncbi:MAG: 3-hydroxyisobutyrate dehydrogenase [Rhodospirillales bacterium]
MANIGFIGLGNMGGPMAANLINADHQVKGFDVVSDCLARFKASGGTLADNVSDAVADVDFVITMLPAGKHVRDVYLGEAGILASRNSTPLLIDCSTIDVETARDVAAKAQDTGLLMLDAPVSGGVMGAEAASLTIMVGGPDTAFDQAAPILENMGKNIIHAGGAGNGQVAKVCNNMILGISMIGVGEAFVLAEKLGLDHQKLFDISSTASGQCWSMTSYCPVPGPVPTSPANRNYEAGFTVDMMLKDLRLSQEAAHSCGATTPLGAEAAALYELFEAAGQGGLDFSGIINLIRGNSA